MKKILITLNIISCIVVLLLSGIGFFYIDNINIGITGLSLCLVLIVDLFFKKSLVRNFLFSGKIGVIFLIFGTYMIYFLHQKGYEEFALKIKSILDALDFLNFLLKQNTLTDNSKIYFGMFFYFLSYFLIFGLIGLTFSLIKNKKKYINMFLFIFDFDNTLGDAYGPYGEGNIFRTKTLPDIEKATEIYQKYRRGPDDILVYEKLLKELNIHHPEEFFIQAGMPNQLFPDVVPFLTKLQNIPNVKTVILTAGDELFHEMKVRITGASKLVNQVIVTRIRNKTDIIKRIIAHYEPESTVFVDDRIHMTAADFDTPITIYDMDRTHKKEGEFVIHGLDELPLEKILGTK